MAAVVQAIKKAVPEPFKVVESDISGAIHVAGWRAKRGVGQDFTLELGELCADEDREYCWLTAATAVGPTRLGLEFTCRPGLREAATKIIRDDKLMGPVWKAGFVRDETDARLFIPIVIPTLAAAFEQNDLSSAMAPVTKAVEQAIAAMPELEIIAEAVHITGFLAESGRRYVRIQAENGSATLPYEAFSIANKRLAADLVAAGLPVFADKDLEAIVEEVRAFSNFQSGGVVEHSGWNGKVFAHLDGKVISGDGPPPEVLFQTNSPRVSSRGTLDTWKRDVAKAVKYHPLPAFAVMAMFVPPLLRFMPQVGNVIIELVGPGDIGKSLVQAVAASAVGPKSYVSGLRDVQRDLAGVQRLSRDYPLVIDYVAPALATATKPKKAELFTAIDYDLARAPGCRLTLLSGRLPLRDACLMPTMEDGIITLSIPPGPKGVLALLPEEFDSYAGLADSLMAAASANHGTAFPAFVEYLHADLQTDPKAERAKIDHFKEQFLTMPEVQANNGAEHRLARTFAAVYAAASLASEYGVLPKQFLKKKTTLAVLGLCQQAAAVRLPFLTRLENLVSSGQLVTITKEADPEAQALVIGNAVGSLTITPSERIVKIPPEKIEHAFADWKRIRSSGEARAVLKLDGKNLTTWGHLGPSMERTRLHQFVLPSVAAEQSMFAEIAEVAAT